jgi:hypothetical protein
MDEISDEIEGTYFFRPLNESFLIPYEIFISSFLGFLGWSNYLWYKHSWITVFSSIYAAQLKPKLKIDRQDLFFIINII